MELICPSCEARYEVPNGAIGEKGRQVSCMNCGHSWHTYPPLVLGATHEAGTPPPPPSPVRSPAGGLRISEGMPSSGVANRGADKRATTRSEQLAEIREILAEVQADESSDISVRRTTDNEEPGHSAPSGGAAAAAAMVGTITEPRVDEISDPLRDRLEQRAKEQQPPKPVNVDKMRRRHERREKRKDRAKAAGSGAFLTGFLLIAIIAAVMIALYLLRDPIVTRMPGTEPAMTEYVETVDSIRASLAETFSAVRDWVVSRTERFF